MKNWVETSWIRVTWKNKKQTEQSKTRAFFKGVWDHYFIEDDMDDMESRLTWVTDFCNENQFEIKTIIPLDRAEAHNFAQADNNNNQLVSGNTGWGWGLGYGWGFSKNIGFAALIQKTESLDAEEYNQRIKNKAVAEEQKAHKSTLTENLAKLKQTLEQLTKDYQPLVGISDQTVQEKGGMLGKKYTFQEKSFKDKNEAEGFRSFCINKLNEIEQEISNTQVQIESTEAKIKKTSEEIKSLLYWKPTQ